MYKFLDMHTGQILCRHSSGHECQPIQGAIK